jgi:hypothetical protein
MDDESDQHLVERVNAEQGGSFTDCRTRHDSDHDLAWIAHAL